MNLSRNGADTVTNPRINVRLAALLATVALMAAACGGGGGDEQEVSSEGTAPTSTSTTTTTATAAVDGDGTTAGAGAPSEGTGTGGGDAGGAGGSGDGGEGGGGDAPEPPSDPSAPQPLTAGVYEYDTDGETKGPSGTEPMPEVTTLEAKSPDGARQRTVRDLRDEEGEGSVTTVDLLYRDTGVHIEHLKIVSSSSFGTFTFEFEFDPPELVLPTDPDVGFHTQFSVKSSDGSIEADVTIDITGRETLTIGGTSVETLKTKTVVVFSGTFDGKSTWNDNVDPERYLVVREDRVSDTEVGVSEFHNEYVATLQKLQP